MLPLAQNAAVPLTYLEQSEAFSSFFTTSRNLFFGFLSQCPLGNKHVMKEAYIASKHEARWNQEREEVYKHAKAAFEKTQTSQDPEKKYRYALQQELDYLDTELEEEYPNIRCGHIQLRDANGNYLPRWLQVFLNQQKSTSEQRVEATKQIEQADDYALLLANICGEDDKSGGRSALGKFSEIVFSFITKEAQRILEQHNVPVNKGGLFAHGAVLERISQADRNIVALDRFTDMVASVNTLVTDNPLRTIATILQIEKPWETAPIKVVLATEVAANFPLLEKTFIEITKSAKIPPQYDSLPEDRSLAIQGAIYPFYFQCEQLHGSLSDFLTLMQVHLAVDFELKKSTIPKSASVDGDLLHQFTQLRVSGSQHMRRSGTKPTASSPVVSPQRSPRSATTSPRDPRTTPLLQTPTESPRRVMLRSSGIASQLPASPKVSPRDELYVKRGEYCKVFECTKRVLEAILTRK